MTALALGYLNQQVNLSYDKEFNRDEYTRRSNELKLKIASRLGVNPDWRDSLFYNAVLTTEEAQELLELESFVNNEITGGKEKKVTKKASEQGAEDDALLEDLIKFGKTFRKAIDGKTKPEDEKILLRKCPNMVSTVLGLHSRCCSGHVVRLTTWHAEADKHGPIGGLGRWVPKVEVFCDTCKVLYRE